MNNNNKIKADLFTPVTIDIEPTIENIGRNLYKIGDKLKCPVCNKVFSFSEENKYIIKGGYTCTWKCFLNAVPTNNYTKPTVKGQSNLIGNAMKEKKERKI